VLDGIGGFGGLFELDMTGINKPVLVSGTDGVGTKIKIAFLLDKHDTVGIDCVAMCVNDIICCGAKPQFFLDYIACGKNYPEKIAQIVSGVAEGCVQAGCALIGGETAEHPGLMPDEDYDLAGFSVGVVEKEKIIDNNTQKRGGVIIGLKSSGLHSNGFSLVRKIFDIDPEDDEKARANLMRTYPELNGKTLGEVLLEPTRIYVSNVLRLLKRINVKAIAHITGGGFFENIPRMLPEGIRALIKKDSYEVPPIFRLMQKKGEVEEQQMYNTFNMGLGMVLAVDPQDADKTIAAIEAAGEKAFVVGSCISGKKGVDLC
jgi:phosphoribosylformylglycinamidine cyclo-ligase